ncbi:MAG: hypothetical protein GY796_14940 [Chloroflexi bacterium]|nr:hypothetical protein [Chloroflexota bacterium]
MISGVVAIGMLFLLVQLFAVNVGAVAFAATKSHDGPGQPITPTVSFDEALAEYLAASTTQNPPQNNPTTGVPENAPQASSIAWSGDESQFGLPGDTLTTTLTLTNTGDMSDTFGVSAMSNWAANLPTITFTLAANTSANVLVGVTIPGGANVGDADVATITAVSQNTPTTTASVAFTTTVGSYGVVLHDDMALMDAPGKTVFYALTLENSGNFSDTYAIDGSGVWSPVIPVNLVSLAAYETAVVTVSIQIPLGASEGEADTAVITATSQSQSTLSDAVTLTTTVGFYRAFLPVLRFDEPLPPVIITPTATRPNSNNNWVITWTDQYTELIASYDLQESQDPDFATGVTTYQLDRLVTSQRFNMHDPSPYNVYYYRLRSRNIPGDVSAWSTPIKVISAYYDEFDDNSTGWDRRRVTHIDETIAWYEIDVSQDKDWLIVQSLDSWDWVIASPLMPAPEVPYKIEYDSKHANLGNLVSHGAAYGADWNGDLCPDPSTVEGWYEHTACFNHFYNTNTIWFGDLKLLFERVDYLEWRPQDGGSPMKRGSDSGYFDGGGWFLIPRIPHTDANDWNSWRIEVRETGMKFYANGRLYATSDDTRWIHDPYFGIFASTDEYSNSTARIEFFKITPLDN